MFHDRLVRKSIIVIRKQRKNINIKMVIKPYNNNNINVSSRLPNSENLSSWESIIYNLYISLHYYGSSCLGHVRCKSISTGAHHALADILADQSLFPLEICRVCRIIRLTPLSPILRSTHGPMSTKTSALSIMLDKAPPPRG